MKKIFVGILLILSAVIGFVVLSNARIAGYPVVNISINETQKSANAVQNNDRGNVSKEREVLGNPDNKFFGYFLFALTVLAMIIGIIFIVKSQSIEADKGEADEEKNERWMLEK